MYHVGAVRNVSVPAPVQLCTECVQLLTDQGAGFWCTEGVRYSIRIDARIDGVRRVRSTVYGRCTAGLGRGEQCTAGVRQCTEGVRTVVYPH